MDDGEIRQNCYEVTTDTKMLDVPKEVMDKMNKNPLYGEYSFTPVIIPKGTYKGQDRDITTVQQVIVYLVDEKMSVDVAYGLTKAIFENQEEAVKIWKEWAKATQELATQPAFVPFHPGSEKYFKEKGWIK